MHLKSGPLNQWRMSGCSLRSLVSKTSTPLHYSYHCSFLANGVCLWVHAFLLYATFVVTLVLILIFHYAPQLGHTHVMVYIAICSLMGSLSVRFLYIPYPWLWFSIAFANTNSNEPFICTILHIFANTNEYRIWSGYECESARDRYEADVTRTESVRVSSDIGVRNGGSHLRTDTNELPQQGTDWSVPCFNHQYVTWDSETREWHVQALDTFNTAIVSPIYYVMFTSLTIMASAIMFKVCTGVSFHWRGT